MEHIVWEVKPTLQQAHRLTMEEARHSELKNIAEQRTSHFLNEESYYLLFIDASNHQTSD